MELSCRNLRDYACGPLGIGVFAVGRALGAYAHVPTAPCIGNVALITTIGLAAISLVTITFICAVLWTVNVSADQCAKDLVGFCQLLTGNAAQK